MTSKPTSSAIEVLTPVWEQVLQRSPILPEDNFFDLGGDSLLAVQLFAEIERVCGRALVPVTIYCAPTIALLSTILDEPSAPRFPPLMLLKDGAEPPPIFLAHGLGGTAMDFFQLVKHLKSNHAVYGMQAKGADGIEEPFDRIEDLAEFQLDAIQKLQPHGPYYLVGYSLGGLVALEIAQRLSANGEKVALLTMVESYPHARFLPARERARLATRMAKARTSTVGKLSIKNALSYIIHPSERGLNVSRSGRNGAAHQTPASASFSPAMQHARDSAYQSLTHYKPRFYKGTIKFVRAETVSDFPDDPSVIWSNLAEKFSVETVPGDHLGILGTHYESLAAVISRHLREAAF